MELELINDEAEALFRRMSGFRVDATSRPSRQLWR